mmetsp:Transcript_8375/g.27936  ORF Transcript_8375/g.27936 Transcript_8375/m.27936 type:complete len:375 (-) Transcript_8375:46-1170(-)
MVTLRSFWAKSSRCSVATRSLAINSASGLGFVSAEFCEFSFSVSKTDADSFCFFSAFSFSSASFCFLKSARFSVSVGPRSTLTIFAGAVSRNVFSRAASAMASLRCFFNSSIFFFKLKSKVSHLSASAHSRPAVFCNASVVSSSGFSASLTRCITTWCVLVTFCCVDTTSVCRGEDDATSDEFGLIRLRFCFHTIPPPAASASCLRCRTMEASFSSSSASVMDLLESPEFCVVQPLCPAIFPAAFLMYTSARWYDCSRAACACSNSSSSSEDDDSQEDDTRRPASRAFFAATAGDGLQAALAGSSRNETFSSTDRNTPVCFSRRAATARIASAAAPDSVDIEEECDVLPLGTSLARRDPRRLVGAGGLSTIAPK